MANPEDSTEIKIALGDTITTKFMAESTLQLQDQLYAKYKAISVENADIVVQEFVADKDNEAIGQLYEVKEGTELLTQIGVSNNGS